MKKLKKIIRKYLPETVINCLIKLITKYRQLKNAHMDIKMIKKQPKLHAIALRKTKLKAQNGEPIKVAFFSLVSSVWKYEGLYKLFEKDDRFEPIVVVCPVVNYGRENMLYEMEKAYTFFKENGYRVVRTYDEANDKYLDVKKEIDPDIVFYTNPYKGLIDDRYFITEFRDRLTCYVRYFFQSISADEHEGMGVFNNRIWMFFCETEFHREQALSRFDKNQTKYIFTGYPGVEGIEYRNRKETTKNDELIKIIWAPHHTIDPSQELYLSNFLEYHETMFSLTKEYSNKIIFIFKPHPLLKVKLYEHIDWGKQKTDKYYDAWKNSPNTELKSNDYITVFNDSDAMIFDCNSFVSEYLYTGKPALFMFASKENRASFNEFGEKALNCHYHGYSKQDLIEFIENIVILGNDVKKSTRDDFYRKRLIHPNNKSASQNIVDEISREIF